MKHTEPINEKAFIRLYGILMGVLCFALLALLISQAGCQRNKTDFTGEGRVCLLTMTGEQQTDNMSVVVTGEKRFADGTSTRGSLTLNGIEEGCFLFRNGAQDGVDVHILESPCFQADDRLGVDLTESFTANLKPGTGFGCRRAQNGQHYPVCSQFESHYTAGILMGDCAEDPPEICEDETTDTDLGSCCSELLEFCCNDPTISSHQPQGNDICDEFSF